MTGNIHKIIVITAYPFNLRDQNRFGIDIMRDMGFTVEIWDISTYLHKSFADKLIREDPRNFSGLRIFKEKREIIDAINTLGNDCIINCFIEYCLSTLFIFREISRHKIPYCVVGMIFFPSPIAVHTQWYNRIPVMIEKLNPKRIKKVIHININKILLKYSETFGISPASIILLAGDKSTADPTFPVNGSTKRLWMHSLDYDIFLQDLHKRGGSGEENKPTCITGVYLDEYLPLHPDFLYMGIDFPISPEGYYPKLNNFFTILEKKANVEIIIAAHPRSDYDNLPDYFCGRKIIKGKTADLVKKSSFVITHFSTSLAFAILYHKPIVFITLDALQKMTSGEVVLGLHIPAVASELGKKPVNLDHLSEFNWDNEMKIDSEAYQRYKNNYIKKQGTPEQPIWEIFCSYIRQNNIWG